MEWKTHTSLGILFAAVGIVVFRGRLAFTFFEAALWTSFFAIAPDFDIVIPGKHRNSFTHSIFTVIFVFLLIIVLSHMKSVFDFGYLKYFLNMEGAFFAASGVFSHVVADSLTASGVPFFFPFSKKKHSHFPLIGGRLRYSNKYANSAIQIASIIVVILLLVFDVLKTVF
ncbi:MAG: metal-dependent hydrolase [Candidatus Methanofastidiosia archaeon]